MSAQEGESLGPPSQTPLPTLFSQDYATTVQILGQGLQTPVFRSVFLQLADHLVGTVVVRSSV